MASNRQFIIARDGIAPLLLVVGATLFFYSKLGWWAFLFALPFFLALFILFRNPHRSLPAEPHAVVSPMDGVVEIAEKDHCPHLNYDGYHVRVRRRRCFASYYIRSPIEGWVRELRSSGDVETTYAWELETDEGDEIVVQMSGDHMLSNRSFRPRYGERIGMGQRAGTRMLGSVVDIWLPANTRLFVQSGQRVRSGCDILATLIHK